MRELIEIQRALKAPKNQFNGFGKYHYRNCEDILEGLKPLLAEHGCSLTISDKIEMVGERFYLKATATIKKGDCSESVDGYARECLTKKGMDESQITGSASSYARKYALNGLFLIDDTKDADTQDNSKAHAESKEDQIKLLNEAFDFFTSHNMQNRADVVSDMIVGKPVKPSFDQIMDAYRTEKAKDNA